MLVIGIVIFAFDCECRNVVILHQCGGDIILRGKRIRSAHLHICAACLQYQHEIGSFSGYMKTR